MFEKIICGVVMIYMYNCADVVREEEKKLIMIYEH